MVAGVGSVYLHCLSTLNPSLQNSVPQPCRPQIHFTCVLGSWETMEKIWHSEWWSTLSGPKCLSPWDNTSSMVCGIVVQKCANPLGSFSARGCTSQSRPLSGSKVRLAARALRSISKFWASRTTWRLLVPLHLRPLLVLDNQPQATQTKPTIRPRLQTPQKPQTTEIMANRGPQYLRKG